MIQTMPFEIRPDIPAIHALTAAAFLHVPHTSHTGHDIVAPPASLRSRSWPRPAPPMAVPPPSAASGTASAATAK